MTRQPSPAALLQPPLCNAPAAPRGHGPRERLTLAAAATLMALALAGCASLAPRTELPAPPVEPPEAAVGRRIDYLEQVSLLDPLSPDLVRRIAEENIDRVYAAGEQVIRQGATGDSLFVIMRGSVEVTAREGDHPMVKLAVLGPGDYFGEMSLMTGASRMATITTLEETQLLEVGKESFRAILAAHPALVEKFGRLLQVRLAERTQAIAGVERAAPESHDIFQKIRDFFMV